ncbi:Adenylate cyclase type 10 [Hondaea fermentalgiana]|uniref:Adenylate cyclase type 10 n=1 Tax=Hondaea fermentalgiana TaxID=2315210 RepID=A0A2R5GD57_9STRA|nr:Adenylate cyclase type 10 [Hondaea fermentalgiana]|eukprot:GBG28239.1 Adenylate cyclase type 10 [Hondaea fermentalgiana]
MKGFTKLAQNMPRTRGNDSILFIDESWKASKIDASSEFTSAVLAEYWGLVIMYANKFSGDVIKFLGDAVQIVFPVRPLFSHIVNEAEAEKLCQDRALLFALELMRALEFFEISSLEVGTNKMKLKIGLAFGDMSFRVVGGVLSRCEFVLSGPAAAKAADLSSRAKDDETVAELGFGSVDSLETAVSAKAQFVRLRMSDKFPEVEALYHTLTQTEDYYNVSVNMNPYLSGNALHNEYQDRGIDSFARFQKLVAKRASQRSQAPRPSQISLPEFSVQSTSSSIFKFNNVKLNAATRSRCSSSQLSSAISNTSQTGEALVQSEHMIPLLSQFVPMCALSQIVAGCHNAQLGHRFCSVLFISIKNYDPEAPEEAQTALIHQATCLVQSAIYSNRGDLRQVAVDDKGLVLIAVFGLAAEAPELPGFSAALQVKKEFAAAGIKAGLGLTTGSCHYGPTGADTRAEYAVVGSTVNLSARLMGKAVGALSAKSTRFCNLLIDANTFKGLPLSCTTDFIHAALRVKGVDEAVEIYFPIDEGCTLKILQDDFTIQCLALCRDPEIVRVSAATHKRMRRSSSSVSNFFVADIFRITLGMKQPESVREVLKYITVMGVVNRRIDAGILYAIIPSHAVRTDLNEALEALEKELEIIEDSGDQVYLVRNVEKHIRPLYQTLMRSFRHQLHRELAEIYQDQLLHGHLRQIPRNSLHEMIGSHYALAGVDFHLQAAEFLNEGLRRQYATDPKSAEATVQRSQRLVHGSGLKMEACEGVIMKHNFSESANTVNCTLTELTKDKAEEEYQLSREDASVSQYFRVALYNPLTSKHFLQSLAQLDLASSRLHAGQKTSVERSTSLAESILELVGYTLSSRMDAAAEIRRASIVSGDDNDDSGGLSRWLGEAKTNSRQDGSDNRDHHGVSFKFNPRDLISGKHDEAFADAERSACARRIQRWLRERKLKYARWLWKRRLMRTKADLRKMSTPNDRNAQQQLYETEEKLCALTPMYLQWLLRTKGPESLKPETCHRIEGVVAFVDMKGFTNLAQYLAKKNAVDATGSSVFLDQDLNINLSSELTNVVLGKYWELVIMYAHKFQGSVLKYLGDAVQIIFPIEPLFTNVADPEEAASSCQNRGLMFTLELLRALEFFEIASLDLGTSRMSLKIGLAYGKMSVRVLGGVASRCEFVLSGETSELAAELSGKANHDEAIVHESIAIAKEMLPRNRRDASFVRVKVGPKYPKVADLYQYLTQTGDYFDASLYKNPYKDDDEEGESTVELLEGVRALNHAQHLAVARAKERRASLRHLSSISSLGSAGASRFNASGSSISMRLKEIEDAIETKSQQDRSAALSFDVLGRFVPICALSQIAAGCHTSQLGQGYCAVLFIEISNYDPTATEEYQTIFMQVAMTLAQVAIYQHLGDLRQVAVDDKGLVIIGMFGISAANAEASAFDAAMQIKASYAREGIVAAIGIASGACHFGPTGAATRNEYAVVGSTVNLSARLMARASKAANYFHTKSFILTDHTTFLGLPAHCATKFATSNVKVKGFERAIQVFSPLDRRESLEDLKDMDVPKHLGFERETRIVKVTHVTKRSAVSFRERQKRSGFVADIHRLTVGLERSESVQEVLKHVAVMGVVNPRIDVTILYSVIQSVSVCSDLSYSLQVLENDLQILQDAGNQVYMVRSATQHVKPLYETLMQSFRTRLHQDLATIYEKQVRNDNLKDFAKDSLHVIVGSHYALAGVEHHLKAAEYLNKGLSKIAHHDLSYAALLARRSRKLVQGWQRKQQAKAEKAKAMSMYLVGGCELKSNNYEQSFGAFVAGLRCYGALKPLLKPRCKSNATCRLLHESAPNCNCLLLRPRMRAYLFVHHTEDAHSSTYYLRGMKVESPRGSNFHLTPFECANLSSAQPRHSNSSVCVLEEMSEEETLKRYQMVDRDSTVQSFYQIYIHDAAVAKLVLHMLAQLAKVSSMMEVKSAGQVRSTSFTQHTQDTLTTTRSKIEFHEENIEFRTVPSDQAADKGLDPKSELGASVRIQRFLRKAQQSDARKKFAAQYRHAVGTLEDPDAEPLPPMHLGESRAKVIELTSNFLQWTLSSKSVRECKAPYSSTFETVVVHIYVEGLTEFARHVTRARHAMDRSILEGEESTAPKVPRSGLSPEVVTRFWEFLIGQIRTFQGDAIKILDDSVQVIFPVEPLFSHINKSHLARTKCQSRGLLFALDLMHKLNTFEIDRDVLAKDHMRTKLGIAFGKAQLHIAGSRMRHEVLLSGEAPALALDLCVQAHGSETLVHESITDVKDRVVLSKTFVRLRMDVTQPTTKLLYERLVEARDYLKLAQADAPYMTGSAHKRDRSDVPSFNGLEVTNTRRSMRLGKSESFRSPVPIAMNATLAGESTHDSTEYDTPQAIRGRALSDRRLSDATTRGRQGNARIAALSRFVPRRVVVELLAGCFVAQLESCHATVLTIIVSDGSCALEDKVDTLSMSIAISIVDSVVGEFLGDFMRAWLDHKGLNMTISFGNGAYGTENEGLEAALKVRDMLRAEGFKVALGLASGLCKIGVVGSAARCAYSVVGGVPRLSARLADRATSLWAITDAKPLIIVDQSTFYCLPPCLDTRFVASEIFPRGFERNLQIFFPLDPDETMDSLRDGEVIAHLSIVRAPLCVRVRDILNHDESDSRWRRQHGGFVADISRLTVGLDRAEAVQTTLKYIAVMGVVDPRIDAEVLYSLMPVSAAQDVQYALEALQTDFQILRHVHKNSYSINDVDNRIQYLYENLLLSYRMEVHRRLGNAYTEHLTLGTLADIPKQNMQIIIGSHFAHAGPHSHLDACSHFNQASTLVSSQDPLYGTRLAARSYKLADSWLDTQFDKAENTLAKAQFLIGKMEKRMGNLRNSFNAFVTCLRSFAQLAPLLHPPCKSAEKCNQEQGSLDTCDCYRLATNARAILFIHHAPDPYSRFQFRCLEVISTESSFLINPLDCSVVESFEKDQDQAPHNCHLQPLDMDTVMAFYKLQKKRAARFRFYRLVIMHRQTTQLILGSFIQMASITLRLKAMEYLKESFRPPSSRFIPSHLSDDEDDEPVVTLQQSRMCAIM